MTTGIFDKVRIAVPEVQSDLMAINALTLKVGVLPLHAQKPFTRLRYQIADLSVAFVEYSGNLLIFEAFDECQFRDPPLRSLLAIWKTVYFYRFPWL